MPFLEDFKKPFNFISLCIAIIAIFISFVFYYKSKEVREIKYILNEPTSKIFDSENSTSAIKLLDKNSLPINGNVYILNGKIWNNGNLSIKREDIRKQLSIRLTNCLKILDFRITKQFDSEVAKFILLKQDSTSITIDWSYFDPKYGFAFQIMYVGKDDPGFQLSGKILGIDNFTVLDKNEETIDWSILGPLMFLWIIAFMIIFFAINRKINISNRIGRILFIFSLFLYFIVIFGTTVKFFMNIFNHPVLQF